MKDEHTYGKKMAREGRTKVIYKGTFVSKQSLGMFLKLIYMLQVKRKFWVENQATFQQDRCRKSKESNFLIMQYITEV